MVMPPAEVEKAQLILCFAMALFRGTQIARCRIGKVGDDALTACIEPA